MDRSGVTLSQGNRGLIVRDLQLKIGAKADGSYGPRTMDAVCDAQAKYSLPVTGRADPATQRALGCELVLGADISHYQHECDVAAMQKAGVRFIYCKTSEGRLVKGSKFHNMTTGYFREHRDKARRVGMPFGSYHFAKFGNSAEAELENWLDSLGGLEPGDPPPMLDFEKATTGRQNQLDAWVEELIMLASKAFGRKVVFYTYPAFLRQRLSGGPRVASTGAPLWTARYNDALIDPGYIGSFAEWQIWQWTCSARIPGVTTNIDLNWLRGGAAGLEAFIKGSPA